MGTGTPPKSENIWKAQRMKTVEINGKTYSEEYVKKALSFYEDLQDGTIACAIKKGLKE